MWLQFSIIVSTNFFVYQSIEACILGTLCYIGMRIFNFPYAATISILIGFSAMIPVLGAYIGVTIGTILIMTHSVTLALLFVAYVVILQQFEGNLIYPYVVGGSTGLPVVWVILAITIGSALGESWVCWFPFNSRNPLSDC